MTEIIKIPGTNISILKKFYDKLFEDYKDKLLIFTPPEKENKKVTHYITVKDIDKCIEKIRQLGGKIVVEKTPVPRMGYFIEAEDPEGNYFGLWQEDEDAELYDE